MAGRPKPTTLKLLQGNPGKRPLNLREPHIGADLDAPPDFLTDAQAEHWRHAIAHCPPGMLKATDKATLANYCVHFQTFIDATTRMADAPMVICNKGRWCKNPLLSIIAEASASMMRCCVELGFSPAARSKVCVDGDAQKVNEFAAFAESPARRAG